MIRVWLANEQQQIVLNIGFWKERGIDERAAWRIVVANMVHHVANAHEAEYGYNPQELVAKIRAVFQAEMEYATPDRLGEFVNEHRAESG